MALSKDALIKLISVDQAKVVSTDWISSREAAPGDIALVEEVFIEEDGQIVRLLCEYRMRPAKSSSISLPARRNLRYSVPKRLHARSGITPNAWHPIL